MTDEQYRQMMDGLARSGKISGARTDMQVPRDELMRRLVGAQKAGLLKPIEGPGQIPAINQNFPQSAHDHYSTSNSQVDKNHEELSKLGFPDEMISPLMQKRSEESLMMRNLERNIRDPDKKGTVTASAQSSEEKRLGLDPEKYTKKPWNPQDYSGYSNGMSAPKSRSSNEAPSDSLLAYQQQKILGGGIAVSQSERGAIQDRMMRKLMGLSDDYNEDQAAAIKELGWDVRGGSPIVPDRDEDSLRNTIELDLEERDMTPRERLIMDALTDWRTNY